VPKRGALKWTEEIWTRMLARITAGETVVKVCRDEGIDFTTFWYWLRTRPELAQEYDRAKAAQLEMMMDSIIQHAEDLPDLPDPAQVAAKRLSVDTRRWVASKLLPKKYGDRVQQDVQLTVDYASLIQARIERLRDE
jgi:transposase-like protein